MVEEHMFVSGHTACAGCGQALAVKLIFDTLGKEVIVVNATGCLEVFSTGYPNSAWNIPFIHSLFENAAAVASGIEAALKHKGISDVTVISQGGDGSTADIGLQALSGMWERGHNVLSICYDNEAYMNTGIQRSGLTPTNAYTTTSPTGKNWAGNWRPKKNMVEIALAHNCPYVATATVGYIPDLQKKIKKAASIKGPKFLHVLVPCPLGWGHDTDLTYEIAQLAVQTGFFPILEYEYGKLVSVIKPAQIRPVEDYLRLQRRFAHLLKEDNKKELDKIKEFVNNNIIKYNLKS